jgi:hypothetical protein
LNPDTTNQHDRTCCYERKGSQKENFVVHTIRGSQSCL